MKSNFNSAYAKLSTAVPAADRSIVCESVLLVAPYMLSFIAHESESRRA